MKKKAINSEEELSDTSKQLKKLVAPEWEPQVGEPLSAYTAFSLFLRMGEKRSYKGLAILQGKCTADDDEKTIYNARTTIGMLASRYRWNERVKKYEQFINEQSIREEIDSKRRILKRHEKVLEAAEKAMTMPLMDALQRMQRGELKLEDVFPDNFASVDEKRIRLAKQTIETFLKIVGAQRTAMGEPSDIINNDITSKGNRIRVIIPPIPDTPDDE